MCYASHEARGPICREAKHVIFCLACASSYAQEYAEMLAFSLVVNDEYYIMSI